jgi:hypothetical protein
MNPFPNPAVLLITGIMAAGKSTIAQHAAERLPRSVHLRGDLFRRMIVGGRAEMEPPLSEEAFAQLRLRYQLAAQTAQSYCDAGFTVVCQDIIIGPMLTYVIALYTAYPLYVVVLCPSPNSALERDAGRHKHTYTDWTPHGLDQELRTATPKIGLWVDSTDMTVEQTINHIFANLDQALVRP